MKKIVYILFTCILALTLTSTTPKQYQLRDTRSVIKSLYIYTFATLVEWPKQKRTGPFRIGVFGESTAVYDDLVTKYSGKSIGSQTIVIENFRSKSSINDVHILYISEEYSHYISEVRGNLSGKSTLLVTEKAGSLSKGAMVNFIVEGDTQKYEINKRNAKKQKLVIADKLSSLAARVVE